MIDLGTLVAKIQVDSGNSISDLQNFQKNVENAKNKSTGLKDTLKKLAAGFALGAAIKKTADAVVGCVKRADELKESLNTLQTQTGATDEEMQGLGDSLKNIYADNYGESFDDIAVALAEVKNQTNLTGTELERTTENALALSDTFDFEIQESTRAADMMMKQFGVTSDEAFNLIAQGAQNGLDKNGNLLDSINEYSVHFKQLGFDAEDMFNMFSNGAKAGVFDVDKLGDAVKEFGIRCKDGSNTTIEAFESLGFNADELQQKFAQGGESAQDAFQEVVTALNNCDDEVVKNTAGVNLFGTMWEDMGADAVKALTDTNGEFDKTADNLNKIKEIKYDSLENAFEGIKRQIETGLVLPIGEKLLPKLNEFANYINDNMPDIKNTVESVMDGICSAISFVTDNLNIIIPILAAAVAGFTAFQIISTIAPLFTMIQTAIAGTTTVQAALNAVMVANPFGAVAVALAALVAAGVALYMNWDTIKTKCEELLAKVTEV
ncbi:phage tail tape measure protein [Anaerotignum faecicola]